MVHQLEVLDPGGLALTANGEHELVEVGEGVLILGWRRGRVVPLGVGAEGRRCCRRLYHRRVRWTQALERRVDGTDGIEVGQVRQ